MKRIAGIALLLLLFLLPGCRLGTSQVCAHLSESIGKPIPTLSPNDTNTDENTLPVLLITLGERTGSILTW